MQPDPAALARVRRHDLRNQRRADPRVAFPHVRGKLRGCQYRGARRGPEAIAAQRRPVGEGPQRADGVDPPERAAEQFARSRLVEVRRPARLQRECRQAEFAPVAQRRVAEAERRDDRDLGRGQLGGEGVFLEDLRVAPAPGAVELQHHRRRVLAPEPVDAVLVAVQREQVPVRLESGRGRGIQHRVRSEAGEWRRSVGGPRG